MLSTLIWVLTPLFLGFAVYIKRKRYLKAIDSLLMILIYLILVIMGLNLSSMENISEELTNILWQTLIYIVAILGCNMIVFYFLDRHFPLTVDGNDIQDSSNLELFLNAAKLLSCIIFGLLLGLALQHLTPINNGSMQSIASITSQFTLMVLLFLVGIQLRSSGISLRKVFLNKYGIYLCVFIIVSSFTGGIIAALLVNHPITTGLAISSGFGWYSLSTSILQKELGATIGSIAFFNDLFREFFAFAVIPILMKRYPLSAIGSGGATSLDFVLPIIQRSGGIQVVPIAISFGFIINIISPVLLIFFASLGKS